MPASLALLLRRPSRSTRRGTILAASPPTAKMFQRDPVGSADRRADRRAPRGCGRRSMGVEPGTPVPLVPLEGRRSDGVPFALDVGVRVLEDGSAACAARGRPPAAGYAGGRVRPDAARDGAVQHRRRVRARQRRAVRAARAHRRRADRHARPGAHASRRPPERPRRRLAHPARRAEHLAVREALRAARTASRLDARQPDLPARRVRPPAVLGRPVPGHHRAAPDGLARPADRRAQPARVRHRARALRVRGRARCSCSTSTASRTSTTRTATRRATSCCG